MKRFTTVFIALGLLLLLNVQHAHGQGSAITYQGRLTQSGTNYTGLAEIQPTLWDALNTGNQVAANNPTSFFVDVTNGLFTCALDFGTSPFTAGAARWLQLGVRTTLVPFTTLIPRQPLTATPYAITASYVTTSANATNFSGSLAGDVTGKQASTVVSTVGGQTAGTVVAGVNLANAATSVNTANSIVKRDGAGSFSAGAITAATLSGQLNATNLTGTVPLARLSGITSDQLDPATWQYLVALASGSPPAGMVLIPAGEFTMGNSIGDSDITDATPITVNVSAFYMDTNLVSYSQWTNVYNYATNHGYSFTNAGSAKAYNHPVHTVNWYDCVKWCNARSEQAGRTPVYYTDALLTSIYKTGEVAVYPNWSAKGFRLPTEVEWEKAARGSLSGKRFPWGDTISQTQANYYGSTGSYSYDLGPNGYNPLYAVGGYPYTSPVGSFAPNGYGLYDMAGNVWQWCWDWYGTPYAGGVDPRGASTGSYRVLRGGSWLYDAIACRSANRYDGYPPFRYDGIGFRSVLPPGP